MDEKRPVDVAEGTNAQIELHDDRVRIRWKDSFGNPRRSGRTHTDVLLDDVERIDFEDATGSSSGRIAVVVKSGRGVEPANAPEPVLTFKDWTAEGVRRVREAIEGRLSSKAHSGAP